MEPQSLKIEDLYDKYADNVYSLARFKGLSAQDAQDIVQETYAALISVIGSFRGEASVKVYILSIARRKIADFYRKSRSQNVPLDDSIQIAARDQAGRDEAVDVKTALQELDDEQRELVHMVFTQGLSLREAADALNIPEGTVKSRMFKIRSQVKSRLGDDYNEM